MSEGWFLVELVHQEEVVLRSESHRRWHLIGLRWHRGLATTPAVIVAVAVVIAAVPRLALVQLRFGVCEIAFVAPWTTAALRVDPAHVHFVLGRGVRVRYFLETEGGGELKREKKKKWSKVTHSPATSYCRDVAQSRRVQ